MRIAESCSASLSKCDVVVASRAVKHLAKLEDHTVKLDEHLVKLDEHTAKLDDHMKKTDEALGECGRGECILSLGE